MTKEEHLELHKRAMECGRLFYLQTEASLKEITNTEYKTTYTEHTPKAIKALNDIIAEKMKEENYTTITTGGSFNETNNSTAIR